MGQPAAAPVALRAPRGVRALVGRTVVLKIGGAVVADRAALAAVGEDAGRLAALGARLVVVHGGGPQIDATMRELGRVPRKVAGLRLTDAATLEVVEMVLAGRVNPRVVAALSARELLAVGLSGREAGWLRAERLGAITDETGRRHDPGRVGRSTAARMDLLVRLLDAGIVPVVAPIGTDPRGDALNVNADDGAGAIAAALEAHALVLYATVGAVRDARGASLSRVDLDDLERLEASGVVSGGMIPKLRAARRALCAGVTEAHVVPPDSLAATRRLLAGRGPGTALIRPMKRGTCPAS